VGQISYHHTCHSTGDTDAVRVALSIVCSVCSMVGCGRSGAYQLLPEPDLVAGFATRSRSRDDYDRQDSQKELFQTLAHIVCALLLLQRSLMHVPDGRLRHLTIPTFNTD